MQYSYDDVLTFFVKISKNITIGYKICRRGRYVQKNRMISFDIKPTHHTLRNDKGWRRKCTLHGGKRKWTSDKKSKFSLNLCGYFKESYISSQR